ncbi:hypothetical protein [Clostridium puniceum]|uniref:hypothetical protein n=1 Tax=Clostridium puniceum TaxID=29367 RepID=UPI00130164E2|nr:hypothetical protein [Clostridium puniceum]
MDLCGQKIIGLSMNERMTKELVINALDDAYNRAGRLNCSQYISFIHYKDVINIYVKYHYKILYMNYEKHIS